MVASWDDQFIRTEEGLYSFSDPETPLFLRHDTGPPLWYSPLMEPYLTLSARTEDGWADIRSYGDRYTGYMNPSGPEPIPGIGVIGTYYPGTLCQGDVNSPDDSVFIDDRSVIEISGGTGVKYVAGFPPAFNVPFEPAGRLLHRYSHLEPGPPTRGAAIVDFIPVINNPTRLWPLSGIKSVDMLVSGTIAFRWSSGVEAEYRDLMCGTSGDPDAPTNFRIYQVPLSIFSGRVEAINLTALDSLNASWVTGWVTLKPSQVPDADSIDEEGLLLDEVKLMSLDYESSYNPDTGIEMQRTADYSLNLELDIDLLEESGGFLCLCTIFKGESAIGMFNLPEYANFMADPGQVAIHFSPTEQFQDLSVSANMVILSSSITYWTW